MKTLLMFGITLLSSFGFATWTEAATFTDFESFTTGVSVDGQGGWKATNSNWDEEVVDLGGNKAWRVSNKTVSGSFGDQPFAPHSGEIAGETGSTHVESGNPASVNRYIASFDFWSVTGAAQTGLVITVSPDDGSGSRQSYINIVDNGTTGIDVGFYDTDANHATSNPNGGFEFTQLTTDLSYGDVHNVKFDITFVDGNNIDGGSFVSGNDIVKMYVDDTLVHTGTTWESYFWTTDEGQTSPSVRAIDTLLFRLSSNSGGFNADGGGFYIDNVSVVGVPEPTSIVLAGLGLMFAGLGIRRRS